MRNKKKEQSGRIYVVFYKKNLAHGGGAERRILRTLNSIESPNVLITVVTNRACKNVVSSIIVNRSIEIAYLPNSNIALSWCFFLRYFAVKQRKCIVHLIAPNRALFPFVVYALLFHEVIVSITSYMYCKKKFGKSILLKGLIELLVRYSKKIDWLYSYYSAWWKNCSAKSTVTPCSFTNYDEFCISEKKENIILFSGQLIDEKQPIMAINAIKQIEDVIKKASYRVIFLGDGYLKKDLERIIKKSGMAGYVEIFAVGNSATVVNRVKIFLSVQGEENYPSQSFLEAVSAGCVVVATNVGDTYKLAYDTVVLVDNSIDAISEGIKTAIENYDDLTQHAISSRQLLKSSHSQQHSAEYYTLFYKGKT